MSTTASGLRELHQLHIKLRQVQDQLERGPKQINARQQFTQRKQEEFGAKKEYLTTQRMTSDEKSLQLKTNESKIAELNLKLNTASSNREYDIIKGQIDADTMANSVLEDEILDSLEKVDQSQAEVAKLEEECAKANSEEERVSNEITAAEPGLKSELATLESAIADAARTLLAGALAPVQNGACGACYVDLSPQSRVELNSGKVIFCRPCGRLLYLPEGE